jgi:TrmH family RNA methyltransferase
MPEHYPKCGADRNQQRGISKIMTCFSKELAIAKTKSMQLSDLKLSKNPLILVFKLPKNRKYWCFVPPNAVIWMLWLLRIKSSLYNQILCVLVGCLFTNRLHGTIEIITFEKKKIIFYYCILPNSIYLDATTALYFVSRNLKPQFDGRMEKETTTSIIFKIQVNCYMNIRCKTSWFWSKRQEGFRHRSSVLMAG